MGPTYSKYEFSNFEVSVIKEIKQISYNFIILTYFGVFLLQWF